MSADYEMVRITEEERERLERCYDDLMALSESDVPAVKAGARHALASVAQALNGQGLRYELYTKNWTI